MQLTNGYHDRTLQMNVITMCNHLKLYANQLEAIYKGKRLLVICKICVLTIIRHRENLYIVNTEAMNKWKVKTIISRKELATAAGLNDNARL